MKPNLTVLEGVPLKERTTFRIGGPARWFAAVSSSEELCDALEFVEQNRVPFFLLGGGSNLLVSDRGFDGLMISTDLRGIEVVRESESHVYIRVAAGEGWHDFTSLAVRNGWWGVENMALIPGRVGAVPIQNVGAYGQDASQVVSEADVLDVATKEVAHLSAEQCGFAYRRSIFNREEKGRYIVLGVLFRLGKKPNPVRTHAAVCSQTDETSSIEDMQHCIIGLREDGRLADPDTYGNAGSFFQSPFITGTGCPQLPTGLQKHCYHTPEGIRVPAAAVISAAGVANERVGGAALYRPNPTILINRTGNATAAEVLALAARVRSAVYETFGLLLPVEPELVGFSAAEVGRVKTLQTE